MPPFIDLTGQKFGRLTVLEQIKDSKYTSWKCHCSCGNITSVTTSSLRTKKTKSCGCICKEVSTQRMTTHGMTGSPEYKTWQHMKERCYKPDSKDFKNYGGRGINVCQEWRDSFLAFYKYVGPKPHKKDSIDRIDNNGNYEPGNVRWADKITQTNNSRHNHLITINGVTKTVAQWAKFMNINPVTICNRLQNNWSPKKSVLHPVRPQREDTINVNGVIKTTTQWAKEMGISTGAITQRLKRGWSPQRSVMQPVHILMIFYLLQIATAIVLPFLGDIYVRPLLNLK